MGKIRHTGLLKFLSSASVYLIGNALYLNLPLYISPTLVLVTMYTLIGILVGINRVIGGGQSICRVQRVIGALLLLLILLPLSGLISYTAQLFQFIGNTHTIVFFSIVGGYLLVGKSNE